MPSSLSAKVSRLSTFSCVMVLTVTFLGFSLPLEAIFLQMPSPLPALWPLLFSLTNLLMSTSTPAKSFSMSPVQWARFFCRSSRPCR